MRSRASTAQSAIAISAITTVIGLERAARTRRIGVYLLLDGRFLEKLRKHAPASGRWQAKACPTTAMVGHALACLAPISSQLLTVAAPIGVASEPRPSGSGCPEHARTPVIIGRPRPRRVGYRRRPRPRQAIRATRRGGPTRRRFRPGGGGASPRRTPG